MSQQGDPLAAADPRLQLEYEAAADTLKMQSATLDSLRSRATNVLSTAALLTSFSAGIGLLNLDPKRGATFPLTAAIGLLAVTIGIGILVTRVHWPVTFHHGPSASRMQELRLAGKSESQVRDNLVGEMLKGASENRTALTNKVKAFQLGSILLLVDVVILLVAVILA